MFDFDEGRSGGSEGPWLAWSARGTLDGEIAARNFLIRDADGKKLFTGFAQGVVLDIANMKTGWCQSEGVKGQPPKWVWGQSPSRLPEQPAEDYKKGFSIRCAINTTEAATWEQSGASAWNAFVMLVPALNAGPGGDALPLVRMTGVKVEQFQRGSTATPVLEVVKWVKRPPALMAAPIDTGMPAPAPKPAAPVVTHTPVHTQADADDWG